MTEQELVNTLVSFSGSAAKFVRAGGPKVPIDRQNVLALVVAHEHQYDRLGRTAQLAYLRASHLLADVFDKLGLYEEARESLRIFERIRLRKESDAAFLQERRWLAWAQSISHHRLGLVQAALEITNGLVFDLAAGNGVPCSLDFPPRLFYAHARHLQGWGQQAAAALQFTEALSHCDAFASDASKRNDLDDLRYAQELTGLILVQFARTSLAIGDLNRATRQLSIAGVLQAGVRDAINLDFIRFLRGCVALQRGETDAIRLLEEAGRGFGNIERVPEDDPKQVSIAHGRYLCRAKYELAKTCFYSAIKPGAPKSEVDRWLKKAQSILRELRDALESPRQRFSPDDVSRTRWKLLSDVLASRIEQYQGNLDEAQLMIDDAENTRRHSPVGHHAADIMAQITAVRSEILLARRTPAKYAEAIRCCEAWMAQATNDSIDKTDRAWIELLRWKGYLLLSNLDQARSCEFHWRDKREQMIENQSIRAFADDVKDLHQRLEGAAFVISPDDLNLNYQKQSQHLRDFLIRRVDLSMPAETLEAKATRLGVKRQTLANWLQDLKRRQADEDDRTQTK